jgi:hypothetical protein
MTDLEMVQNDGWALAKIEYPTEEICFEAVRKTI